MKGEHLKIFDAHMHYTGKFLRENERLIDFLDRFEIDKAIITTLNTSANSKLLMTLDEHTTDDKVVKKFYSTSQHNHQKVRELVQAHPERLIGFYWFNPNVGDEKDWKELTRYIKDYKFMGVKTQASLDNLNPKLDLDRLAHFCIKFDIPLYFHSGTNFFFQKSFKVQSLYDFKKKHKALKLIIGHASFTMEYMISLIKYFKSVPNVYFETSLSVPYGVGVLIKVMGEDRVLYGSDSPAATTPDIEINKIKILNLPISTQNKVFYKNINDLLALE
jgi:predicted TIM-barrel fold metal-dependent hydrolase